MKKILIAIIIAMISLLAACGSKKPGTTTPDREKTADSASTQGSGTAESAQPAGPQSDLCTDTNCPGVVR